MPIYLKYQTYRQYNENVVKFLKQKKKKLQLTKLFYSCNFLFGVTQSLQITMLNTITYREKRTRGNIEKDYHYKEVLFLYAVG